MRKVCLIQEYVVEVPETEAEKAELTRYLVAKGEIWDEAVEEATQSEEEHDADYRAKTSAWGSQDWAEVIKDAAHSGNLEDLVTEVDSRLRRDEQGRILHPAE